MPTTAPQKIDVTASVISNQKIAPGFWRMGFNAPDLRDAFLPGQFCQIKIRPGALSPLLRRPFAACAKLSDGFEIIYQVVGGGTEELTTLREGEEVKILAPLGTPFTLPVSGGRAILIGGGVGTPALVLLAQALHENGTSIQVAIGAKSAAGLLNQAELEPLAEQFRVATDDGSAGHHGNAVEVAAKFLAEISTETKTAEKLMDTMTTIYSCGPHPMLKAAAQLAASRKIPIQVSLEERMACGFGVCVGCPVAVRDDSAEGFHYQRVCVDGPVFDGEKIVW